MHWRPLWPPLFPYDPVAGDFGLARQINPGARGERLRSTLAYMPYEARFGEHYDSAWDMWSLGCVAFDLASPSHTVMDVDVRLVALRLA